MKVKDLFLEENMTQDFIEYNFDGAYWESCNDFILTNWDRDVETLSQKQLKWLGKIVEDCIEAKIEGMR